jgi:energy-coupling factor transport system ATP-binding protein
MAAQPLQATAAQEIIGVSDHAACIAFQQVSYTYPHQPQPAVHDLSFALRPGEWVGVVGANDAGKTTLAKLCNGLLRPSNGAVWINGRRLGRDIEVYETRRRIGVVFDDPEHQIVGATVEEDLAFGLGNLGVPPDEMRRRIDGMLDRIGLRRYAQREPHRLSGGEQQKLCLASALVMQPECLVLDAPLTFLDYESRAEVLALLQTFHAGGQTLLYCTCDPAEVQAASRVLLLRSGRLIGECEPSALLVEPTLLGAAGISLDAAAQRAR